VLIPLPCPFCGGEPRVFTRRGIEETHFIRCGAESDHLASAAAATASDALAIWNTRATPAPQASTDYDAWKKAWNDNRGPLPQATKLTGERLDKLRRRIKEGLTLEEFTRAAWTCSHTEFLLRGTPKQEFHATFDWLVSNSGVVAKVLDGTYGPTGKTEDELRAEQAEKERANQFSVDRMMAEISIKVKTGAGDALAEHYAKRYAGRVEQWDSNAVMILAQLDAGTADVAPELAEILRGWQKRVREVTTDATATSRL
jgi:hypothetical protein